MMSCLTITFIALLFSGLPVPADSTLCPPFMQIPYNETQLVGGEFWCPLHFGQDICYSCCKSKSSVCCDDGSCMDYDPFCRYPKSCCAAPYCGDQCCTPDHGVPCGPICAPKQYYTCCNQTAGFVCANPDICCHGEICCEGTKHCCEDALLCCGQGEMCCGDKCCPVGYQCMGNGKCCPDGQQLTPSGACCPVGQACNNVTNECCKIGTHCADDGNVCCFDDQTGCGNTCCSPGYICCDGKCCPGEFGCVGTGCCPALRSCGPDNCCEPGDECCENSTTHHCCPKGMMCCHDHCCAADTHYCGPNGECCPAGTLACGDTCCAPHQSCINDDHHTNFCCDESSGSDSHYCEQTGQCCPEGFTCNAVGACCLTGSTYCPGGSQTACFSDPYTVCCPDRDGTACTPEYPECVTSQATSTSTSKKICCPYGYSMGCGDFCVKSADPNTCKCCHNSGQCCYSPFSCQDDGSCTHDYSDGGPWWCHGCSIGGTGIGPHCCHHHHDVEQHVAGVPSLPRMPRQRSSGKSSNEVNSQLLFLTVIRPKKAIISQTIGSNAAPESVRKQKESNAQQHINLPPPPTHKINPNSYDCFNNATLNSTCDAWLCLEDITNCGGLGYIIRMHTLYCTDFNDLDVLFNDVGKQFLTCSANCVTREHVDLYRHGFKPCCISLEKWGNAQERNGCILSCNFCAVYMSNIQAFKALFALINHDISSTQVYADLCGFG